jgi:hypothetical protein
MSRKKFVPFFIIFILCLNLAFLSAQVPRGESANEEKILSTFHSISSHPLLDYIRELTNEKYAGLLTGTAEYKAGADWVAAHFRKWGLAPMGDGGTYLQSYPNPYTLVFKGCEAYLHLPAKTAEIKKFYRYEDEFIPGSTSGSGEISAEVVYVGYGVTAPELGYDDYQGVEVKGKIVLMDREVPVSPDENAELFKKWRPYSFHQYKLENAVAHGAKGMLYNYGPIVNPNNAYREGFIVTHVGDAVVEDVFAGTGRKHSEVISQIAKTFKPRSFATGKIFTLKNLTEHHPEGVGCNIIGLLPGSDPKLRDECIIVGGHLDGLGRCYEIMPGANDNISAVSVTLGVAEALAKCPVKPRRSVLFICFGSEEQAVHGSEYYLEHPVVPLEKTSGFINMDGVGCGDKLDALAAKNFPAFWSYIDRANQKYIHRVINTSYWANIARPRLDAARFMWKGVPTLSFSSEGGTSYYHVTKDSIDTITPEILEDLAQLLFAAVLDMANAPSLNFRQ